LRGAGHSARSQPQGRRLALQRQSDKRMQSRLVPPKKPKPDH